MSGRYLTDLAAVARRAGLAVTECDGWQTRARSSGGYSSGRPTHAMVHHTASGKGSDGWPDVNYMIISSSSRPIANLYLNRAGALWVMAAGATNTNGSGGPIDGVPADSMNSHAVGIEAGNDGIGEPWPAAQQDALVVLVAALQAAYGLAYCRAHLEWAPGRKIDPAGPSRWSKPSGGGGSNMWRMDDFRASVAAGGGGAAATEPEGSSEMLITFTVTDARVPGATYVSNGMTYRKIQTPDDYAALTLFMTKSSMDPTQQKCTRGQLGWAGAFVGADGRPAENPDL